MTGSEGRTDPHPAAVRDPVDEYDRFHWAGEGSHIICPWCGGELRHDHRGVTIDDRTGYAGKLCLRGNVPIRVYHPRCREVRRTLRRAVENAHLSQFTNPDGDESRAREHVEETDYTLPD